MSPVTRVRNNFRSPRRFVEECEDLAKAVREAEPFGCRNDGLRMDVLVEIAKDYLGLTKE